MTTRTSTIHRKTGETDIQLELNLEGSGQCNIDTGIGFFDHMLILLARHSLFDITIQAKGDLHVDDHHTVEDVGICFGKALVEAVGDKSGMTRYGSMTLPMDETLVTSSLDFSGRPFLVYRLDFETEKIGTFDTQLVQEFWQAVANNGMMNLHLLLHHGSNSHHIAEASFKATARALRQAVTIDPRQQGVPSSKGTL
ncbi:Imidazoleglycerol-phosphate dehydratase [hydrothermal vent metagenome]|uniref:Imidazoleglycerol-phosphate dehydratase n=1 Tax=hydrothermal vent metagenome TaxID=652676 RepID=A0A3B1DDN2_9ZZZZ